MAFLRIWQHPLVLATLPLLVLLCALPVQALDAALGKTYLISERDFLDVIREKLEAKQASGELADRQRSMAATAKHTVENPTPVPGITRASTAATHYYDPSVVATADVLDADGKVVVKAGTKANPLDYMGLSKILLFIDAADKQQVAYADQYYQEQQKTRQGDTGGRLVHGADAPVEASGLL